MKLTVTKGATSQTVYLFIRDSSATTGAGLTGLAYNSGSLVASYVRPLGSRTAITLATQTVTGAWSSGGFVEVDATNMPGVYRLDVPDAVFASGVNSAIVMLKGATNMESSVIEFALEAVNAQDAVRGGMTALPNANAEAAGGLYTRGTGAGQINQANNGQIDANAARTGGTTNTGRDIGASVLLSSGTGTGQISLSSGAVLLQATQTGVTIPTVTTLTNAPSDSSGVTTLLSRLSSARAGYLDNLSAGAVALATSLTSAAGDITTLLGKFSGITSVAQWLGLIAGKQTGNSTARTELRATGAGSGTFDETTDSIEALRDRGDAAWVTATGFATAANLATMQGNVTDILADTADMQPKLGTPAGASISADIAAIEAQTDDIGTAGAGLTAVPWNAAWDAEVQSEVADALAAYGAATATNVSDAAANVSVDEIQATALADLFNTDSGTDYASAVAGSVVKEIADNAGGSSLTAADIADAVWDEILSGHAISGSTGEALAASGGAGDPWITALPGSYSAGQAGYILGTNLNATVGSRATQTSVDTLAGYVDTEVAAIKAKTDNLPADPADASDIAALVDALPTAAENATAVWGAVARTLTAIDEDSTTLDLDATIRAAVGLGSANLDTQIGDLPTAAENADAVWDEAASGHVSSGTTGLALVNTDLRGSRTVIRGTSAGSATTTTMTPSALSPAGVDADQFKGRILIFDNDTTTTALRGQATDITANTAAGLPVLTFTALTTAPASGDTFSIV